MPSPAVLLYEVLVAEYRSQDIQPLFPEEEFARRRAGYARDLAAAQNADTSRAADPDPDDLAGRLDAAMVKDFYAWLHRHGVQRSALCFSGGGIRSATFGLGLVQGLARHRMLDRFDYLSTVSGGGYLGSWLTAWISRLRELPGEDRQRAIEGVESQLSSLPGSPLDPEPEPLRYLRSYSRYMSPKLGLLSADTWTLFAIFLRNLLLNWLVLLPLLAAALMVPRLSVILVRLGTRPWFQEGEGTVLPAVFWAAVVFGSCSIAYIIANRPSLGAAGVFPRRLRSQGWFLVLCLLPLALMAILITLYWAWVRSRGTPLAGLRFAVLGWEASPFAAFTLFGVLLHVGGFLLSRLWVRKYALGEFLVTVLTGALGGAMAWLAFSRLFPAVRGGIATELYVCFAAPLLLFLFLLAATLFVGLASYFTTDADREWLARCGAWVLIAVGLRAASAVIVILGPVAVLRAVAWITSIGSVSGLVTLYLGRSSRTKGSQQQQEGTQDLTSSLLDKLLVLAAPVFAVSILVGISLGTTLSIRWLTETWFPGSAWPPLPGVPRGSGWWLLSVVYDSPWKPVVAVLALFVAVGAVMGFFVDINRFSLHAAYRDRLIRAYLGASRGGGRRPNPFTGFDDEDNLQMKSLRGNRPFHVVNMALNLVAGKNLAWQDRKAETFTASPLHAGSFRLGYRDAAEYGRHRKKDVALSLGTALAISGAAASPNMGYHSSPVVTFLLALFNVRLGWWLGNPGPAGDHTYATQGPRFAPLPLFAEAFGLTDSRHPYVYLSDGGHFENLALYEMILRRCHFIVVSDAGEDPAFTFEDLGNAVSKIRVDLGVPIRFEKILLRARRPDGETYDVEEHRAAAHSTQPYCALARICYSCVDGVEGGEVPDGLLLYIKPSLNGTEPVDVFHYARLHPLFPHEPTANQLYSEPQ
ncbi:MAG TPA: patatin-like phospholipase family protein, partial [Thermoanaerobaculia bacterium]